MDGFVSPPPGSPHSSVFLIPSIVEGRTGAGGIAMKLPSIDPGLIGLPPFASALLRDRTIRLAVTGLSRAGKSVFVTALVHALLAYPRVPGRLPLFGAGGGLAERIVSVGAELSHGDVPRFRYAENLAAMAADPPRWPDGTTDVAEIDLRIRFRPGGFLHRRDAVATLRLVIVDYPGEWLLDLPLLDRSYHDWSAETLALAADPARAPLAGDWLAFLARHPADRPLDPDVARTAHDLYRAYLVACRDRLGLAWLQPGRFLCPGDWGDDPVLHFCPIAPASATTGGAPPAGSLGAAMAERFDAYRDAVRTRFFDRHFRRFDRQIVLVDVLRVLHAGRAAFVDTRHALERIAASFRVGGGLLARLFGSRIDRVLYAATKADHVPGMQRDNLRQLLSTIVSAPSLDAAAKGAATAVLALASIRCTEDDETMLEGRAVPVVRGVPIGGRKQVKLFPGTIPIRPPAADDLFWKRPFFALPPFQPPRLDAAAAIGVGHVGLDEALDFLIGDALG
ncbi:MAG: YcjX family protein [Alphaproteobacteria bacterium]